MSIAIDDFNHITHVNSKQAPKVNCGWSKATYEHNHRSRTELDKCLVRIINNNNNTLSCKDMHCVCAQHKHNIDLLYDLLITAGLESIPIRRPTSRAREVPGWSAQVKSDSDRSLFWHWIWLESGKPQSKIVYDVMKRAKHRYHYGVL